MEQIKHINDIVLEWLDSKEVSAKAHGLAEPIVEVSANGSTTIPGIIDQYGEVDINIFDDRYSVGLYHKMTGKGYDSSTSSGYGDSKSVVETINMSMVVYGMRSKVNAHDLEQKIVDVINSIRGRAIGSVKSAVWDRNQVFSGEFNGVQFFLKPNIFLFKVNYTITTTHRTCE